MSVGSVSRIIPGVAVLRSYRAGWLRSDVMAGLILTALLVPQGMAYAELAGLPPITGLYTSILCLAGYAVFGPSKVLVLGPDSSLGPMIAACIIPLVAANGSRSRGRVRLRARPDGRGDHRAGRGFQARVRRGPAVQTHPDRLHERPGIDHRESVNCRNCSGFRPTATA